MSTTNSNRYLFVITSFDQEPDRTAAPLVLANNALAAGGDVLVWLTHDGVELARNGAARSVKPKSFPALSELLENYRENGGRIGVCPPCGKSHGVTDADLPANASWMGAQALLAEMEGRQSLAF
jgi:uncharacterized protein involved in oxidation of intracellular sulfur